MTMPAVDPGRQHTATRLDRVRELQARVRQIEDARVVEVHDVLPALRPLFPSGGIRVGVTYTVAGSAALASALLAGASAGGSWCGVVGLPTFGAEAAAAFGVDLGRTVVVADPGEHWVAVTSALVDVLPLVVLRPPERVRRGDVARLQARLRQRAASLVALGDWPSPEARLSVGDSRWLGLGAGRGHLRARRAAVHADLRTGRRYTAQLWLPDADNRIRPAEATGGGQALTGVGPAPVPESVVPARAAG